MDFSRIALENLVAMCNIMSKVFGRSFRTAILAMGIKYEPGHEKMCLMSYANNKGTDQPAHPRSLISVFVFAA